MSIPALQARPIDDERDVDVTVLLARRTDSGPLLYGPEGFDEALRAAVSIGFRGGADELVRLPARAGDSGTLALAGIGDAVTSSTLRAAAGSALRQLGDVEHVAVLLPATDSGEILAVLEGAGLGAYRFTRYKSTETRAPQRIDVHTDSAVPEEVVSRAEAVVAAVARVKDLVSTPANDLYPESFARLAAGEAEGLPIDVRVWDEDELAAGGFGGILGVGAGSARGPRLVKVSYDPPGADAHLALVGKGITFDSGGLSLKQPGSMVGMKYDMTGAATVLSVVLAAARLRVPTRLTAWLCLAENMPSGSATRPNDVLRIRGGRTVEVLNTDAEGRLVLADGLVAAGEEHPDGIVDVATLTGAATVALGTRYAAVMGEQPLVDQVVAAAGATGELFWPMPLPDELRARLDSPVADLVNATPGNSAAGMLLAGVFLREFVPVDGGGRRTSWAHLDIASAANNSGTAFGPTGTGPTGVGVRMLLALAETFPRAVVGS